MKNSECRTGVESMIFRMLVGSSNQLSYREIRGRLGYSPEFSRGSLLEAIPFGVAHTYMAYIRE